MLPISNYFTAYAAHIMLNGKLWPWHFVGHLFYQVWTSSPTHQIRMHLTGKIVLLS